MGKVSDWHTLHIDDYTAKLKQTLEAVDAAAIVIASPEIETVGDAKQINSQKYELARGAGILLKIPDGASSLIYSISETDPKNATDRVLCKEDTNLGDIVIDKPYSSICTRAMDAQGNYSDPVFFTVIYKPFEYKPVFNDQKGDLFAVREARFKIPETVDDLKTVLKGILEESKIRKIIDDKQAKTLIAAIDEL